MSKVDQQFGQQAFKTFDELSGEIVKHIVQITADFLIFNNYLLWYFPVTNFCVKTNLNIFLNFYSFFLKFYSSIYTY